MMETILFALFLLLVLTAVVCSLTLTTTRWFLVPYQTVDAVGPGETTRYCAMDDRKGITWDEGEIPGDLAVVKASGRRFRMLGVRFSILSADEARSLLTASGRDFDHIDSNV